MKHLENQQPCKIVVSGMVKILYCYRRARQRWSLILTRAKSISFTTRWPNISTSRGMSTRTYCQKSQQTVVTWRFHSLLLGATRQGKMQFHLAWVALTRSPRTTFQKSTGTIQSFTPRSKPLSMKAPALASARATMRTCTTSRTIKCMKL